MQQSPCGNGRARATPHMLCDRAKGSPRGQGFPSRVPGEQCCLGSALHPSRDSSPQGAGYHRDPPIPHHLTLANESPHLAASPRCPLGSSLQARLRIRVLVADACRMCGQEKAQQQERKGSGGAVLCMSLGHNAQGQGPAQHCASLPWARGLGLGSFLGAAGDGTGSGREQKQMPSVMGSAEGRCWQGHCHQMGESTWPGLGAAMGSVWGRAGAKAWHHHADEAAPGLCQAH